MNARAILHTAHTWGGLTIGLLIAIVGISGSALVFRADIERWQAGEWTTVAPLPERLTLERIVAIGAAQIPEKEVVRVLLPQSEQDSIEVILQKRRPRNLKEADLVGVFVDPYRGTVLGQRSRGSGWLWQLQDLHYALFAGETGLKINGIGAAVLLALAITGPILWWPGWARRRIALRVRRQPPAARWRDLHAVVGVISCLILALISVTALYYAYRSTATAVVALASGSGGIAAPRLDPSQPPPADASGAARASLDELVAAARTALPSARLDELRPSRQPTAPASVAFRLAGDSVFGRHRAYLDARDARVMRIDRHETLPAGARLLANMGPWHFGSFGGRMTQWLWFIVGLLPAGLFASGLWLWLRRRRRTSAPAAATVAAAVALLLLAAPRVDAQTPAIALPPTNTAPENTGPNTAILRRASGVYRYETISDRRVRGSERWQFLAHADGSRMLLMWHDLAARNAQFTVVLRVADTFRPLEAFVNYWNGGTYKGSAHFRVDGNRLFASSAGRSGIRNETIDVPEKFSIGTHPVAGDGWHTWPTDPAVATEQRGLSYALEASTDPAKPILGTLTPLKVEYLGRETLDTPAGKVATLHLRLAGVNELWITPRDRLVVRSVIPARNLQYTLVEASGDFQ